MTSSAPPRDPAHHELLFTLRASEAGPFGVIRLARFLDYLQEAAGQHAALLGASVHDLLKQNLTWVLSRYHIQMMRYPVWGETVRVRTWPSGSQHLYALREFEVMDQAGNVLCLATSSWMVIDFAARKPVRPADRLGDFPYDPARALADDFRPLPMLSRTDQERTFFVRQGDLDWNKHANHVAFIEWAAESAPTEVVTRCRPCEIEVDYRGEARYGDVVISRVEAGPSSDGPSFVHQVVREKDGAELARLRTVWTKA